MADEPQVIRGINWRETFPFTHIFRTFRVAVHPSKLILALAALLVLYIGGRILDAVWPGGSRAVPNEIALFQAYNREARPSRSLAEIRKEQRDEAVEAYAAMLRQFDIAKTVDESKTLAVAGEKLGTVKDKIIAARTEAVKAAEKSRDDAVTAAKNRFDTEGKNASGEAQAKAVKERDSRLGEVEQQYRRDVTARYDAAWRQWQQANAIEGEGLFITFFGYEVSQVNAVWQGVVHGDWLSGTNSVVPSVLNMLTVGPGWAFRVHPLYAVIFGLWFLAVFSIFGGAICRIAAVHVARDEKLSMRQALKFSVAKFLSFVSAPIIPLAIVVALGIVVAFAGWLLMYVPPLLGLLFILALAAGFVMTLLLIGTAGGLNLMYPTIGVEGSDSFDAISRSFSYVYSRPWRMLFYTAVALAYGALTYLFVRIFVYLSLALTHYFVGWWSCRYGDNLAYLWPMIWPSPSFDTLPYSIEFLSLSSMQAVGAFLVAFWVYLVIAAMGAYAISFYFSANTIIYFLMRREVDATELDDVYLEQPEEEPAAAAPAAPSAPVTAPATAPATETTAPVSGEAAAPAPSPAPAANEPPAAPAPAAEPPAGETPTTPPAGGNPPAEPPAA